jgi:hypothetical protein
VEYHCKVQKRAGGGKVRVDTSGVVSTARTWEYSLSRTGQTRLAAAKLLTNGGKAETLAEKRARADAAKRERLAEAAVALGKKVERESIVVDALAYRPQDVPAVPVPAVSPVPVLVVAANPISYRHPPWLANYAGAMRFLTDFLFVGGSVLGQAAVICFVSDQMHHRVALAASTSIGIDRFPSTADIVGIAIREKFLHSAGDRAGSTA